MSEEFDPFYLRWAFKLPKFKLCWNPGHQHMRKCGLLNSSFPFSSWACLNKGHWTLGVSLVLFIFNISIRLERFNLNFSIHNIFGSEFSTWLYKQILITPCCISESGMIYHEPPSFPPKFCPTSAAGSHFCKTELCCK